MVGSGYSEKPGTCLEGMRSEFADVIFSISPLFPSPSCDDIRQDIGYSPSGAFGPNQQFRLYGHHFQLTSGGPFPYIAHNASCQNSQKVQISRETENKKDNTK